jgi:hypothetical protein
MLIPDPGYQLPIPDLGYRILDTGSQIQKQQQKRGVKKKFVVIPSHKFHKIEIILVLKCWRKKFGPIFKELQNILPKKLSLSSPKYGFGIRDLGSGIRDPGAEIRDPRSGSRDPGSRKNLFRIPWSKRHRIPDPDPQHWGYEIEKLIFW